jgi:hypothetical protein
VLGATICGVDILLEVVEGLFMAGGSRRDLELYGEDLSKGWAHERRGRYSEEAPTRDRWW